MPKLFKPELMMAKKTKQVRRWPIGKLRPHPRQYESIPEPSELELCELIESMRSDGQRQPLEILPCGTILAGHRRCEAAKRLGWKNVDVVVREDLADDPAAAVQLLLSDNQVRGHYPPLARIRVAANLLKLENESREDRTTQLRFYIETALQCSGRTANRYLELLNLPVSLQTQFDQHKFGFREVPKLRALQTGVQEQIAVELAAGSQIKDLLNAYVPRNGVAGPNPITSLRLARNSESLAREIRRDSGSLREPDRERIVAALEQVLADLLPGVHREGRKPGRNRLRTPCLG